MKEKELINLAINNIDEIIRKIYLSMKDVEEIVDENLRIPAMEDYKYLVNIYEQDLSMFLIRLRIIKSNLKDLIEPKKIK